MEPMTGKESSTECRSIRPGETPAYLEFARLAWGNDSPRSGSESPVMAVRSQSEYAGIERDLLVLTEGKRIVGAHHRMRVPWCVNGQRLVLPSLHDLSVLPSAAMAVVFS